MTLGGSVKLRKFEYQPNVRSVSRRTMVRGCVEELKHGNSVVKLYASLLAKALIDAEPKLKQDFQWRLDATR
jgi:hypothetical protein